MCLSIRTADSIQTGRYFVFVEWRDYARAPHKYSLLCWLHSPFSGQFLRRLYVLPEIFTLSQSTTRSNPATFHLSIPTSSSYSTKGPWPPKPALTPPWFWSSCLYQSHRGQVSWAPCGPQASPFLWGSHSPIARLPSCMWTSYVAVLSRDGNDQALEIHNFEDYWSISFIWLCI